VLDAQDEITQCPLVKAQSIGTLEGEPLLSAAETTALGHGKGAQAGGAPSASRPVVGQVGLTPGAKSTFTGRQGVAAARTDSGQQQLDQAAEQVMAQGLKPAKHGWSFKDNSLTEPGTKVRTKVPGFKAYQGFKPLSGGKISLQPGTFVPGPGFFFKHTEPCNIPPFFQLRCRAGPITISSLGRSDLTFSESGEAISNQQSAIAKTGLVFLWLTADR
jgi:hypothetical protein